MSGFTAIDLASLPVPDVVEVLDFEVILAEAKTFVLGIYPEFGDVLALESEPTVKILQAMAYREYLVRQRVNDAARAVLLPTATGADLDNIASFYGVIRLIAVPADVLAIPPTAAVLEGDAAFRLRIQLALEGFSTAGPSGAYLFHALSADGRVKDAGVISPAPGEVRVTILSTEAQGVPSAPVLSAVSLKLNDQDVRPLCDTVVVQAATIVPYGVTAALSFFDGPDAGLVRAEAEAAVQAYVTASHRVGRAIRLSALYAALHRPGVASVVLTAPVADVLPTAYQAAFCTAVTVTVTP